MNTDMSSSSWTNARNWLAMFLARRRDDRFAIALGAQSITI
jgi:hypothetical protein